MSEKRRHPRVPVPQRVPLRCEIRLGKLSFEATVVDISMGGIGMLVYDAAIHIDPGTRIRGARILHAQRAPLAVELEIRHVTRIVLPAGGPANRAGCRIFGAAQDIEALVQLFLAGMGE